MDDQALEDAIARLQSSVSELGVTRMPSRLHTLRALFEELNQARAERHRRRRNGRPAPAPQPLEIRLLLALRRAEGLASAAVLPRWALESSALLFGVSGQRLALIWVEKLIARERARSALMQLAAEDQEVG